MKIQTILIDKDQEERVEIYAHSRNELVQAIEQFVNGSQTLTELIGYQGDQGIMLSPSEVCCFMVQDNKTFALVGDQQLRVKQRLYQLEEQLGNEFVKINQSALANLSQIERFDTSISGTILVKFKNGHRDYVSRRNLKQVKERLGI